MHVCCCAPISPTLLAPLTPPFPTGMFLSAQKVEGPKRRASVPLEEAAASAGAVLVPEKIEVGMGCCDYVGCLMMPS